MVNTATLSNMCGYLTLFYAIIGILTHPFRLPNSAIAHGVGGNIFFYLHSLREAQACFLIILNLFFFSPFFNGPFLFSHFPKIGYNCFVIQTCMQLTVVCHVTRSRIYTQKQRNRFMKKIIVIERRKNIHDNLKNPNLLKDFCGLKA